MKCAGPQSVPDAFGASGLWDVIRLPSHKRGSKSNDERVLIRI